MPNPNSVSSAFNAIEEHNKKEITKFLQAGGNIDAADDEGRTLLAAAIEAIEEEAHEELPLYLIKKGADVSLKIIKKDEEGNEQSVKYCNEAYTDITALQLAYQFVPNPFQSKLFNTLLKHKDVNPAEIFSEGFSREMLHFCNYLAPGENALRHYLDGYALEKISLLHVAVISGDELLVEKLCTQKNVSVNSTCSMVHNRHLMGDEHGSELIGVEDGGLANIGDRAGHLGSSWTCRTAVAVYRTIGVTPLHLAARSGNKSMVDLLLKLGAGLTATDSDEESPLDYLRLTHTEAPSDELDTLLKELESFSFDKNERKRKRLMVGEADFSYSTALINKHKGAHPGLAGSMIATEYRDKETLKRVSRTTFTENIAALEETGVQVAFGVDAKNLSAYPVIAQYNRYSRIHFNFPHDRSDFKARTLPLLLCDFFKSASLFQHIDDEIHIALPKNPDAGKDKFYQSYVYGIFDASAKSGYVLHKKRAFGPERYSGYQHAITGSNTSASVSEQAREYIFKKTPLSYHEILKSKEQGPGGTKFAYKEKGRYLKQIDTDSGSSNYASEEEANVSVLEPETTMAPPNTVTPQKPPPQIVHQHKRARTKTPNLFNEAPNNQRFSTADDEPKTPEYKRVSMP